MRSCVLVACGFLAVVARAAERDVTRTFPVEPGCTLNVNLDRGSIAVEESDEPAVRVAIHLDIAAETEAAADRIQRALSLEIGAANNTVSVRARNGGDAKVFFIWDNESKLDLTCHVVVPRRCNAILATRRGGINVGNLVGRMVVRAENGSVFLRRIDGAVDATTEAGDVILSRCTGDATLKTRQGTIRAGTIGGRSELRNGGGDIEVLMAHGGVDAAAEVGDVTVGFPRDFTGDAKIDTCYGNILVKIDPAAGCVLKASSLWGHVQNLLPLAIQSGGNGRSKLTGRLNAGGPELALHANGGQVKITPGETLFE